MFFSQAFPVSEPFDDSDINAASLLRYPPVTRESQTAPSLSFSASAPLIAPVPLDFTSPSSNAPVSDAFPFHLSTPFNHTPSAQVVPENPLRNPTAIPKDLIDHDTHYLRAYKKKVKTNWGVVKIQCWWRCVRHRCKMNAWKYRRGMFKRAHFRGWAVLTRADAKFKQMCTHHAFRGWKDLWQDIKYTKYASRVIFEKVSVCEERSDA